MKTIRSICVYCGSSSGRDPSYVAEGRALGRAIAEAGWRLVYGGGTKGIMGAVAAGVKEAGGSVTGIIPRFLIDMEATERELEGLDELIVTENMHERKHLMFERSDAFVALPGGIGTLEEFFEAWTAAYLGMHSKPIVMLDPFGHYEGLLVWLRGLADTGYVADEALRRLIVVEDVDAALAACAPTR